MANRFWINGSGNWSDTSHWSSASGGSAGASVPTSVDDVIFDANSASSNFSVNITTASSSSAKSITSTDLNYNLTITKEISLSTASLKVYGNLNLNRFTTSSAIFFYALANLSVRMSASSLFLLEVGNDSSSIGPITAVNCQIMTDITIFNLRLNYGTLNLNGNDFTGSLQSITADIYPKTLNISNSTLNIGGIFAINDISGTTFTASGSTINLNSNSVNTFFGGGKTYNDVNFLLTSTNGVYGNNTYNNLTIASNKSLLFENNTTHTINGSFIVGNGASILTNGGGNNQHTLRKTSGTVSVIGGIIRGSRATGGAQFFASSTTTNGGYNTGWIFAPPAPSANFIGAPLSGTRPFLVNFTDLSTNGPTSWLWDFGDGTTSTVQNPSKTYSSVGTFNVRLTATNGSGSGTFTRMLYVTSNAASYQRSISGNILFGGSVSREWTTSRSISGTLQYGGDLTAVRRGETNALAKKTFLVKSYDEDGNFQGVIDDVISEISFTQEINTSSSTLNLTLARNSDSRGILISPILDSDGLSILDSNSREILGNAQALPKVGPGSDINWNNRIDVIAYYGSQEPIMDSMGRDILDSDNQTIESIIGAPNGRRKFTGYISEILTNYGNNENTEIVVTSYGADLKNYLVNDGAGNTTVAFNSYDPGNIIRQNIDRFKLDAAAQDELVYTDYTTSTVDTTGSIVSYTFRSNDQQDMADKTLELAPAEYYYYIDLGTNLYHFHQRSGQPKHIFYLGQHIENLALRSGIQNSASQFLGIGGGEPSLYKYYNRVRSPYTRRGLIKYSDNRVTLEDSLDIIAEYDLDAKNRVQYKTAINILDKVYPIDSISVGDTVGFRNFGNYVDGLVFQIVGLTYEPDRVNMQLDTLSPTVSKRLADIRRNLTTQETENVPAAPQT